MVKLNLRIEPEEAASQISDIQDFQKLIPDYTFSLTSSFLSINNLGECIYSCVLYWNWFISEIVSAKVSAKQKHIKKNMKHLG